MSVLLRAMLALAGAEEPPLLCQADLPPIGGRRIAWYNLFVDSAMRPIRADLFVRVDGADVVWTVPLDDPQRPTLATVEADAQATDQPASATLLADGHPVASATAGDAGRPPGSWSFAVPSRPMIGLTAINLRVRDAAGAEYDRKLALPRASWLARHLPGAIRAAERDRRAGRCGPSVVI